MMKRLLLSTALMTCFAACAYEEYTHPSPIEMQPRVSKPAAFNQESSSDKFGDEGMEPIDIEETSEAFDPRINTQKEIQDDIATIERRKRAKKLTSTEVKNIAIKRKTADVTAKAPAVQEKPVAVAVVKQAPPENTALDLKLEDDDLDVED